MQPLWWPRGAPERLHLESHDPAQVRRRVPVVEDREAEVIVDERLGGLTLLGKGRRCESDER